MKRTKRPTSTKEPAKHPGVVLLNEFMKPFGLTANRLALALHVSPQRIGEILNGRRGITAETAWRLSKYFGTTAKSWLDLQDDYELSRVEQKWADIIDREIHPLGVRQDKRVGPAKTVKQDKSQSLPTPVKLKGRQKKIYDLLCEDPTHFDILYQNSGMSVGELSATLTILELSRLVKRYSGDRYARSDPKET